MTTNRINLEVSQMDCLYALLDALILGLIEFLHVANELCIVNMNM